jgi:hypothetical protein
LSGGERIMQQTDGAVLAPHWRYCSLRMPVSVAQYEELNYLQERGRGGISYYKAIIIRIAL